MKVLITYPADAENEVVRNYLRSTVDLPSGPRVTEDFRRTEHRVDLGRPLPHRAWASPRSMRSATCCGCGRMRWPSPRPTDLLRWRQRTGYDFGYLATREHHRVEILHRILCALWNGRATIVGAEASPERINVRLGGGVTMTLPLTPLSRASSWGSLLRAYELWALDDNDMHRGFCAELMQEVPHGLREQAANAASNCTWSCGISRRSRSRSSTT